MGRLCAGQTVQADKGVQPFSIQRNPRELLILSNPFLQGTFQPDPLDAFLIYEPEKAAYPGPNIPGQGGAARTYGLRRVRRAIPESDAEHLRRTGREKGTLRPEKCWAAHEDPLSPQEGARTRRRGALPVCRPMEEWDYAEGAVIKGDIRHFFQTSATTASKAALAKRSKTGASWS